MLQYAAFLTILAGVRPYVKVPLLDLKAQFQSIRTEVLDAMASVCEEQGFILGPRVSEFERSMTSYLGCTRSVGVASGSDALLLSLMSLGLKPGDEVITVPFTFFSTASVISLLQATPVFVDVRADTFTLDPDLLEDKITPRTKAIIPVHLFGQAADMERIMDIANRHGIPVVEDACQAIGATRNGTKVGCFGYTGCFSFFPSKNLGGVGDGGLICTQDITLHDFLQAMRVHGSRSEYHHDHIGINSRLDALQAAVLTVKLRHLDQWNTERRNNADRYRELFAEAGVLDHITLPYADPANEHVYNQYTIRAQQRDGLIAYLAEHGIGHRVYYPVPLHLQECFQPLGYGKGALPVSEQMAKEVLSLPIYSELTDSNLTLVVETIRDFYRNR